MLKWCITIWVLSVVAFDFYQTFIRKENIVVKRNNAIGIAIVIISVFLFYKFVEKPYSYLAIGALVYLTILVSTIVSYALAKKSFFRVCNLEVKDYKGFVNILDSRKIDYTISSRKFGEYILSIKCDDIFASDKRDEVLDVLNNYINGFYLTKKRVYNFIFNSVFWSVLMAIFLFLLLKE